MRRGKGSRRIVVNDCEYRWRATGDDGYIVIGIWPTNNLGPYIRGNVRYHEAGVPQADGSSSSAGDQIVVTSRIVRRVIEYAIAKRGYDPNVNGPQLNLYSLDDSISLHGAIRASHTRHRNTEDANP